MRPLHQNEVLGGEEFAQEEMDAAVEDDLMVVAQARGLARREFIMDNLDDFYDVDDDDPDNI